MKRLLPVFFILITFQLSAQWRQISDDTTFYNERIFFNSNSKGFVASFDGVIQRTFDSGQTWDTLYLDTCDWSACARNPYPSNLRCIFFPNQLVGYIGGQDGDLFRTDNGGLTWHCQGLLPTLNDVSDLFFFNNDTGIAVSQGYGVHRTTNGGQTWSTWLFPNLFGTHFEKLNDSCLLLSGKGIFRSQNYGLTWSRMNADTNFRYLDISMGDSLNGIATIDNSGKISKTSDGGLNWSYPQTVVSNYIYSVEMLNADSGFIAGGTSRYDSNPLHNLHGMVILTTDGGATWSQPDRISNRPILDLEFPANNLGFAVGWRGNILRNNNPVDAVGITEDDTKSNHPFLFPNPVSGNLLNFMIPGFSTEQKVNITISDLSGRIIINEQNKLLAPYSIDVSTLSSGSYLLMINVEDQTFASPFVKQ